MNRWRESGVTLVEACVLGVCVCVFVACALPTAVRANHAANASADALQLRTHFVWFEVYKQKHGGRLPQDGGHKFVLSTWTSKVFDHTKENFDMYFSPGARELDPHYRSMRGLLDSGEDPWPDISSVTTEDTHYVGRARHHLRTATMDAEQAWMATDNEGQWRFANGSVNVLFNGGVVRTYAYQDLMERFDLGPLDLIEPLVTWGPNSPIPECQKLDN